MASFDITGAGTGRLDGAASRQLAAEAARSGDAWGTVVAVVRGPLFDGLVRRLSRFEHVDADLAYDLCAEALDGLFAALRSGNEVRDPIAWVRRAALNRAVDVEAQRRRETPYDPEDDGRVAGPTQGDGVSREVLRREALRVCWLVVDQIQQATPRAVMRLILQAVDEGRPDGMPAEEIATLLGMTRAAVHTARTRGLQALVQLVTSEGHALTLDFARRLEDDEPVDPPVLTTKEPDMTHDQITEALEDLLVRCERISRDDTDTVESLLREGMDRPLSAEEAEKLLDRVLDRLREGADRRGDVDGARLVEADGDSLIRDVVAVRRRIAASRSPNGRARGADGLELEAYDGIDPHAVFPRPVFHERTIDMRAGFVRLEALRLWDRNERLTIHLEQFEREHGRAPSGREVFEIMTSRMQLPGVEKDDQFEIVALARSIANNGVRQPPVIGLDGTLYDGNRRVAACYVIRGSDEFTADQKRRVERIFVWQLTEHATADDVDRLLMALNFEDDLKEEWPTYVKARKVYEEWRTLLDLEERPPGPRREAQLKRELSRRFALGPDTGVVNRYIRMVEAAKEFEAHHVEIRHRDRSEVQHSAAERFEYFDEATKGSRTAGGVGYTLGIDDEFKALVFDLLHAGKFAKWTDVRKLRYVPNNPDARRKLEEARDMPVDPDDATTLRAARKEVGLALAIGEASASATRGGADPNERVRVFAEWLRSLPASAFRDGDVTTESTERLLESLSDARRLAIGVLGAERVAELTR